MAKLYQSHHSGVMSPGSVTQCHTQIDIAFMFHMFRTFHTFRVHISFPDLSRTLQNSPDLSTVSVGPGFVRDAPRHCDGGGLGEAAAEAPRDDAPEARPPTTSDDGETTSDGEVLSGVLAVLAVLALGSGAWQRMHFAQSSPDSR